MTRVVALAAVAFALTGCSLPGGTAARPSPSPACELQLPAVPGDRVAIMRDIAAGPAEYLAGVPGARVQRLPFSTGFSPPRLAGQTVFFSRGQGPTAVIYRGTFGGCAHRVSPGTLGEVEPRGRALTALVGSHWEMLDADGRRVTQLSGAAGGWTGDGHLVEAAVGGMDVYDLQGHRRSIKQQGVSPLGPLGASQELVSTSTGVQVMDLDTGAIHPLGLPPSQLARAPAGSPDGSHLAYLDATGAGRLLDLGSGQTTPLATASLATGFAWSHDSQWIAVQSVYGGTAVHVADNRTVDMGSLVVVSW